MREGDEGGRWEGGEEGRLEGGWREVGGRVGGRRCVGEGGEGASGELCCCFYLRYRATTTTTAIGLCCCSCLRYRATLPSIALTSSTAAQTTEMAATLNSACKEERPTHPHMSTSLK